MKHNIIISPTETGYNVIRHSYELDDDGNRTNEVKKVIRFESESDTLDELLEETKKALNDGQ